jgi:hypothetical protein
VRGEAIRAPFALAALVSLAPLAAAGCDDDGEPANASQSTDINGRTISELVIEGNDTTTLKVGTTTQLRATLRYADGTNRDITQDASIVWNTDSATLATVSSTGLVTGVKAGLVKISASYRGIVATESIGIID